MRPKKEHISDSQKQSEVFYKLDMARKRALLLSEQGRVIKGLMEINPHDAFANMLLDELLEPEDLRRAITADFNQRQINEGDVIIGKDLFDDDFAHRMFKANMTSHALVIGPTGSGKSFLLKKILPQLPDENFCVHIFEGEKSEIHDMSPDFAERGFPLYITELEDIPFSDIQPVINAKKCIGPFSKAMSLGLQANDPTARFFAEMLDETYHQFGLYEEGALTNKVFPTLIDFVSLCLKDKHTNKLAKESALSRLIQVTRELAGVRFRGGLTADQLSQKNMLIRCKNVSQDSRDCYLGEYLTQLSLSRSGENNPGPHKTLIIVVDDAQSFVQRPDSIPAEKSNYIRSQNIGLVLSVQNSQIAPMFLSNVANIFMASKSSEDIDRITRNIGYLSLEKRAWLSENLSNAQFLVSLRNSNWNHPFLIQARPFTPKNQPIDPAHILRTPADFERVFNTTLIEATEQRDWRPRQTSTATKSSASSISPNTQNTDTPEASCNQKDWEYLCAVMYYPGKHFGFYTHYFKDQHIKISPTAAKEIREKLVSLKFIELEKMQTHATGRESLIHYPTQKGADFYKRHNVQKTYEDTAGEKS